MYKRQGLEWYYAYSKLENGAYALYAQWCGAKANCGKWKRNGVWGTTQSIELNGRTRKIKRANIWHVNHGKFAGKFAVINRFEGEGAYVKSVAEARKQIRAWNKQAALNFIAGALSGTSFVFEFSGASDAVGAQTKSEVYRLGQDIGTAASVVSAVTGQGAINAISSQVLKRFGNAGKAVLNGTKVICCFVAGTPIHTENGLTPIEEIKVGDKVLSYNEKTKEIEYKPVVHTFVAVKENIVKIKIRGEKLLTTTTEHPFYIKKTRKSRDSLNSDDDEEGEWLTAEELKVGQMVLRPDGLWTRITKLIRENKPTLVYNLEVENNHNYFVGEIGVLSHNCDWSAIKLAGSSGKEMFGDAIRYLKLSGGNADELAKGFQSFANQIAKRTNRAWTAARQVSSDGSSIWTGDAIGRAFVIGPDGRMYSGMVTDASQFTIGEGGVITPIYENLRLIQ